LPFQLVSTGIARVASRAIYPCSAFHEPQSRTGVSPVLAGSSRPEARLRR